MVIRSEFTDLRRAQQALLDEVARHGYSESASFAIRLAVEEALNNAIKHGNAMDPDKRVTICYEVDERCTEVTVIDEGRGFDPKRIPDPTADENIEKPCGRGIMLMRAYMDDVQFLGGGNQVRLVKVNDRHGSRDASD
ncbi:MAG: ATP-binding protein [Phycisphaerae bacterium]|nr:ATP-binding protein [Phycisphaerae bacterium]